MAQKLNRVMLDNMSNIDTVLRVAAKGLIINEEGKVLIVREAVTYGDGTQIGRYGLPGGRIDIGERYLEGLRRECMEEVGLEVEPLYPLFVGEWHPNIKGTPHQIIAVFMACQTKGTDVRLSDEHDEALWINPTEHVKYDMMDPDWEVIDAYIARSQLPS